MTRAAVIGLDGAAWHLLDPLIDAGVMPRLKALKEKGAWGTLASTIPTYTPPAWTSAATGVNPGRHGIYGFVSGHAQNEHRELMHSGKVKAPTIWEMAASQGARSGIYNLPLTYPPQPLEGWMVAGMMTPGFGERQSRFASWNEHAPAPELEEQILTWAPGYVLDVSANYEQDWRNDEMCDRALASLNQRETVLRNLLELDPPRIVFSVLEAPDRLQHVYYRYMDPVDPLYDSEPAKQIRPKLEECFAVMDRVVGLLEDWTEGGGVVFCSDHGFTAWEVTVHVNTLLEQWGYLKFKASAKAMRTGVARSLVPLAKRILPRKVARDAKAKTFSAIDWSATRAFASPIPQQGVFVNLEGREPFGIVDRSDLSDIKDDLCRRFIELNGPDGKPVADRVHRSEEVFHGAALDGAPDILPVLRDHRYEIDDEVFHTDPFSDVTHMPRGVHHPDGVVIIAGEGVTGGKTISGDVGDVTPTLLYLAGLSVPDGLDGKVLTEAFDDDHLARRPIETAGAVSSSDRDEASPYSPEEEAQIEESLRGLGYL